jgi:glycosyltransferase involved in cell wall biosynthesis
VASETPVELILAGDGPLRPGLERLASELGIANKVMFLGDRRDIGAVLRSLDVAVLTSDSEALSNAILEGMAAGLPVVASRVGGNIELVEDGRTGLLFSVGNEGELVRALRSVLASSEIRHQMGSEARRRVLERYHMDVVLNQFRELYRSLLMKKGVQ